MPGPAKAVRLIYRYIEISARPRPAKDILLEIIVEEQWFSDDDALEHAEKWEQIFIRRARTERNRSIEDGEFHHYTFNSRNPNYLQGACFCEPDDSDDVVEAKLKRANTIKLYKAIKEKTADDLETLCVKLLTLMGVRQPYQTPRSGDAGVDFYGSTDFGHVLKPEILPAGSEKHMKVWFIGQAKHYDTTNVSTKDIREVVGTLHLAKSKLFAGRLDPIEHFIARQCDPVFVIFVTTGIFSRDSKELMKLCGVIPMDGYQLGQFLADNGVGLVENEYSEEAFNAWMEA